MKGRIKRVLKEVLKEIDLEEEQIKFMQNSLNKFLEKTRRRIKKLKIDVEVFVGGSFAKKTSIKKEEYDIDLFLRFNKKYSEKNYPRLLRKIFRFINGKSIVHGSRDYLRIKITPKFILEIIPVRKITKPEEAKNSTDLSYFHVKYLNKKLKNKELLNNIKLAKAFCLTTKTYGAESYVQGFSGYSLELLICYYKTFEKFLESMIKFKEKLIIDLEKHYKKGNVLLDMNASKLESPIILVDPTYKIRNVLAALNYETFEKFKKHAKKFLKNPSEKFFKLKKLDFKKIKEKIKKRNLEFVLIKTKTKKQQGDVAGTKLLKFHRHLVFEFSKYFKVKETDFEYSMNNFGRSYFVLKKKEEIIFNGPEIKDKKHAEKFKQEHQKNYIKKGKHYAREKIIFNGHEFLIKWIKKNKRKIKEMYISEIKVY